MNTSELIKELSQRINRPQTEVKPLFEKMIQVFRENLVQHYRFTLPHFGTFDTEDRKNRKAYNPHYKSLMLLPRKIVAVFRPAKALREKISGE